MLGSVDKTNHFLQFRWSRTSFFLCLSLVITFSLFIAVSLSPIRSYDVWWHLTAGKWMVEHQRIIFHDPFSFLHRGESWIDASWLFQVWIYLLYCFAGFAALIIWKTFVMCFLAFLLYMMWRSLCCSNKELGASNLVSFLVFMFLICYLLNIMINRLYVRPHLLSYLYVVWALYVMLEFDSHSWLLYSLFPLAILWVNTHGSFPLLIVIIGCFCIDFLLKFNFKWVCRLALVLMVVFLCFFLNPYLLGVWKLVLRHMRVGSYLSFIIEWKPFSLLSIFDFSSDPVLKLSFLVVFLSLTYYSFRQRRWGILILDLFFFLLMCKHSRFYVFWILISIPFSFVILSQLAERYTLVKVLVVCILFVLLATLAQRVNLTGIDEGFEKQKFPVGVTKFINETSLKGRILSLYRYGGYLIWELWPSVEVFIDGRTPTIYSADDFFFYKAAFSSYSVFRRLSRRYHINLVLLRRGQGLTGFLQEDKNWILVAFDDVSVLFVDRKSVGEFFVRQYALDGIDINTFSIVASRPAELRVLYDKLLNLNRLYPISGDIYLSIGLCLLAMGKGSKAEKWFLGALAYSARKDVVYHNLGLLYLSLKKYNDAVASFEKALKFGGNRSSLLALGISYYFCSKYVKAEKVFSEYMREAGMNLNKDAYWYSGLVLYKLGRFDDAISRFKRFTVLVDNPAVAYYNIGNCYFALGKLKKAESYYLRAMKLRKNYVDAVYNLWKTYEAMGDMQGALKYKKLYDKLKSMK